MVHQRTYCRLRHEFIHCRDKSDIYFILFYKEINSSLGLETHSHFPKCSWVIGLKLIGNVGLGRTQQRCLDLINLFHSGKPHLTI